MEWPAHLPPVGGGGVSSYFFFLALYKYLLPNIIIGK